MAFIRKRGPFQFQVTVRRRGYPEQTRTFIERRDAETWALQIESEMTRGVFVSRVEAERTTLRELIERYIEDVTPAHKGRASETLRLRMLAKHALAQRFVATLKATDFARYRDERLKIRKPATVTREMALFARVIEVARREWDIHMDNPLKTVARPLVRNERTRRLSAAEEEALLRELDLQDRDWHGRLEPGGARNPWVRPAVVLAIETAMRRGELLSLKWCNVDLQRRVAVLPDTKNGDVRGVPLSSKAVGVLAALPRSIDGRVFPTTAAALKKSYERAVERAGIVDLTFHDLRREATSRLARKLSLLDLAKVTGHRSVNVLHQRYYNITAEELALKIG
ncbi:MAG: site-specific integrase [Rhodoferax sp.]|nr:site-specific integrase [Rhodoferax sp.]